MNQDVRVSADGGGEVGVEGHVERIVVVVRLVEHSYSIFNRITTLLLTKKQFLKKNMKEGKCIPIIHEPSFLTPKYMGNGNAVVFCPLL